MVLLQQSSKQFWKYKFYSFVSGMASLGTPVKG